MVLRIVRTDDEKRPADFYILPGLVSASRRLKDPVRQGTYLGLQSIPSSTRIAQWWTKVLRKKTL